MLPLLSVIVPVYKTEPYLLRCVRSIQAQTYQNLEIILVDDGSPDQAGSLCDTLAQTDSRIRVLHKKNRGQASARNSGLDLAHGAYIGFVDSDDWILPEMYETLFSLLQTEHAQIACCGIDRRSAAGHVSYFNPATSDRFCVDRMQALSLLVDNDKITSSPCDKLFCRAVFDGIRMIEGMVFEDFEVMHRCIYAAERVAYTGAPLYAYFQSPDSTLRQNFSPVQFDSAVASELRMKFYQAHCPEQVAYVRAKHVDILLDLLYRSRGSKECGQLRVLYAGKLRSMLSAYPDLPLSRKVRLKLAFYLRSFPLYCAAMDVFCFVRSLFKKRMVGST